MERDGEDEDDELRRLDFDLGRRESSDGDRERRSILSFMFLVRLPGCKVIMEQRACMGACHRSESRSFASTAFLSLMVKQKGYGGPNIWTLAGAGDVKSIEQLLSVHADDDEDSGGFRPDPDARNKLGETAAHIAARQGHAPVLQLLRSYGAQLSATDNKV